jgi:asparagine N-glycosylation enzyme membrane subunit Stt3
LRRVSKYVTKRNLGALLGLGLALSVTTLVVYFFRDWEPRDWSGWLIIQPVVAVAAWLGFAAWLTERWALAAVCFLVTVIAPWGFLYVGALLALGLAIVAIVLARRRQGTRT